MRTQEAVTDPEDLKSNRMVAVSAYVGILFVLGPLLARKSPLARYHSRQGAALFVLWVITGITARYTKGSMEGLDELLAVVLFVLMVLGMAKAWKGRLSPLPVIAWLVR